MSDRKRRQLDDMAASIEASGKSPAMRELLLEGVNAARDGLTKAPEVPAGTVFRVDVSGGEMRVKVNSGAYPDGTQACEVTVLDGPTVTVHCPRDEVRRCYENRSE